MGFCRAAIALSLLLMPLPACGRSAPRPPQEPPPRTAPHASCLGSRLPRSGRTLGATYPADRRRLEGARRRLAAAYAGARGKVARSRVLRQARRTLERGLTRRLAPHWCGTAWAFHGTSQVPGRGRIACGYFVSTLLRDAGLRVARIALARRPAEAIIRSVTAPRLIRRFSNASMDRFLRTVAKDGDGLAIVGLDNHVGFLRVVKGRVTFLHSSYLAPTRVVEEPARRSAALVSSRYRVVGRFTADPVLLRRWLTGARIVTR